MDMWFLAIEMYDDVHHTAPTALPAHVLLVSGIESLYAARTMPLQPVLQDFVRLEGENCQAKVLEFLSLQTSSRMWA